MILMETLSFALLLLVSFLSAVMGTMIGMAMVIMLPAMIFLGIPVHTAIATGRFSMVGISVGNIGKFSKRQKIEMKYVLPFAIAGVAGAIAGALFMVLINEDILKKVIGFFMIVISILFLFEDYLKLKAKKTRISSKRHFISAVAGFFVGSYIGTVGGGGATIIIFLLVLIYGLSFHDAVANQKAVTLPISIIATLIFMYQGLIDYRLGIPLFLANIAGGWIGAHLILKFKASWLKAILIPVAMIFAIKLLFF